MAVPAARHRPGVGLIVAVVALVVAVGVAFAVSAFTADRSKPSKAAAAPPVAGASSGSSAAAASPTIPPVKVTAVGLVKGFQPWSKPLTLRIKNGTLISVKASDDTGIDLPGTPTASSWVSTGQIIPERTYQVQARVRGLDGTSAYHTLSITSTPPTATIGTRVTLQLTKTVGVGFPIVVRFTDRVAFSSRPAVERALTVTMSEPVTAGWHWFSDREVHFRGKDYWPVGEQLTLHDHLTAVQMAPGVWGDSDRDVSFSIGDSHITTVDAGEQGKSPTAQTMTVTVNGKALAPVKVSTGRADLPTLGGIHVVLAKFAVKEMKSTSLVPPIPKFINGKKNPDYYDEKELWATRISNAGAFIHFNPKTLKVQGVAAASHGCVNTNEAAAKAFYDLSVPGDIVNVIHSPAPPDLNDWGMQDWNFSWAAWTAGSALKS